MAWLRAALVLSVAGALGVVLVSGGSGADPRTPPALPGLPPPFLGTAVTGGGGLTAAIDAYGNVVDLRAGPAGRALIENAAERQAAGSVPADTGLAPWVSVNGGPAMPLWRADWVSQRYLSGTNVVRTLGRFGRARIAVTGAAAGGRLALIVAADGPGATRVAPTIAANIEGLTCDRRTKPRRATLVCGSAPRAFDAVEIVERATHEGRRWLSRARPLGRGAPGWATAMYRRSLLVLRALTDRRSGAVAAGARDGWAFVWPRDAGAVALAFAAAGYRPEARRVTHFLLGLDLDAAARFHGDGTPVPGRQAQGDAAGWTAVAARAAGVDGPKTYLYRGKSARRPAFPAWHDRPDYQEGDPGTYLANALAAATTAKPPADGPISRPWVDLSAHRPRIAEAFGTSRGLVRRAGDPGSGLDSAVAWAVRPFPRRDLFPAARRTLLRLVGERSRFGIVPGEGWGGVDPWTAPTAWSAWSLAALAGGGPDRTARRDRRAALELLGALRRASTPAGALPERVDAYDGTPRSTTPLAWSHAFAILALRELWPGPARAPR